MAIKRIRSYALAAVPFIAFFAYQIAVVLPHRPDAADIAHGYTIPVALDDGAASRYISVLDCVLTFGPFLCAALIVGIGLWRSGAFKRKTYPSRKL